MAIPTFDTFFPSILEVLSDSTPKSLKEIRSLVAQKFNFSEEDLQQALTSGQSVFANRANWAATYLKEAGLITRVGRGIYQLSESGKRQLNTQGSGITIDDLDKIKTFQAFKVRHRDKRKADPKTEEQPTASLTDHAETTPEETINQAVSLLQQQLADELLTEIQEKPDHFFEKLVLDLLRKMGYGGSREEGYHTRTQKSRDGGIDGIIKEDKLGLDHIYIQAKRWKKGSAVGSSEIQKFSGALDGLGTKGVFITTAKFTKDAQKAASKATSAGKKIVLIDGQKLTELMIDYGLGLTTSYEIKIQKIDSDYFDGE